MQRAPWVRRFSSGMCRWNSSQSLMRSRGARSAGSSRVYSMNPVVFPMCRILYPVYDKFMLQFDSYPLPARSVGGHVGVLFEGGGQCVIAAEPCCPGTFQGLQHPLVVHRHDLDEPCSIDPSQLIRIIVARALPVSSACFSIMALTIALSASSSCSRAAISVLQRLAKSPFFVEHIGDAAAHAGRKVAPGRAEDRPRCRRSCIRSHGHRPLRPRHRRRSCGRRSARRPCRGCRPLPLVAP